MTLPHIVRVVQAGTPVPASRRLARRRRRLAERLEDSDGIMARRETNTMPQWAGSCWYYLRFIDPENVETFCDKDKEAYWMPVDLYIGGAEHAVLHLLYARFWHKVLYDLGHVSTPEPFLKLLNQGMILGEDSQKMSKSRGNVINPDVIIDKYGADAFRLYEMFMGPLTQVKPWNTHGVEGVYRFLQKVWRYYTAGEAITDANPTTEQLRILHKTIKKVAHDIESLSFNTAISQMMIFINEMSKTDSKPRPVLEAFLRVLAPFAPHLAEELWENLGHSDTLAYENFPGYDDDLTIDDEVTVVYQVNGKIRERVQLPKGLVIDDMKAKALASDRVKEWLKDKDIVKVIAVPDKLVNIVVK